MKPHGRVSLAKVKLLSAFLWIGSGLCGVKYISVSIPPHNLCGPHRCLVQGGKQIHPSSCLVGIVLPCCALRAFGAAIFFMQSVIVTVVNLSIQLRIFIFIPMQQRAVTQSVYDSVMFQPQPAVKSHTAAYSLTHQWDQEENWKGKSQKTWGMRRSSLLGKAKVMHTNKIFAVAWPITLIFCIQNFYRQIGAH